MPGERNWSLLWWLLFAVGVFDAADYFFTMEAITMGHGEANPIIAEILHTPMFPLLKLIVIPFILYGMWKTREIVGRRMMVYAWTAFLTYFSLMVYFRVAVF